MSTASIVSSIPNLDQSEVSLAQRMDQEQKNSYGIPQIYLAARDRWGVEATQQFIYTVDRHLIQLITEAKATGHRAVGMLSEVDDPWEQKALMIMVGRMRSGGNSVTRYPWNPAEVLYLDKLISYLKGVILDAPQEAEDGVGEGEPQAFLTDAQRIEHLEMNVAAIMARLGITAA